MMKSIFGKQRPLNPVVQAFVVVNSGKPHRLAVLTKGIKGKFTTWKKGEKVKVWHVSGSIYSIEKIKLIGVAGLPLMNQLCGVPRSALKFL